VIRSSVCKLALALVCLALIPADLRAAQPLTLALTPSRDPTALQEAGATVCEEHRYLHP